MTDKEIADAARAYVKARKVMKGKSACRATDLAFDRLVQAVESS